MSNKLHAHPTLPEPETCEFYRHVMEIMDREEVPYVVGGGYAVAYYTGIQRHTKDLDLFIRPEDRDRALEALEGAGYRIDLIWPHFLVKALHGDDFVDLLYNSGNGLCQVDDDWIKNGTKAEVLGRPALLCPPEEQLWSKAFVQDRDRFDGADVAHLIHCCGQNFDWRRLLRRFSAHERVLLGHLHFFSYVYPSERDRVPPWVFEELRQRTENEPPANARVCRGTFLSRDQYDADVRDWGYADARIKPIGPLTPKEIKEFNTNGR